MVLTRSAAKQPSPARERPPRPKRTKQPASSKSSKTTSSKTKKGLQKVAKVVDDDPVIVEEEEQEAPTHPKSKKKNGVKLNKDDCQLFASILSQPMFDPDEAGEFQALFTEFQDALQSRVNTTTKTRSGNNSAAVAETPLMKKFFSKCPKYRGKVVVRPSTIQEARESLEVSNAISQSSNTTTTSHVDGAHAETKRRKGKKKVSYLIPSKSPLTKMRVTRSRAKKDQKGKDGLLNVTSSTDASSVRDVPYSKASIRSCSTTTSVVTNDTGIFSQTQTQSTYQTTPMKTNREGQSEMKKVVLDLIPTTINSSKKISSSSTSSSSSSTTTNSDNDDRIIINASITTNLPPPTGKKRKKSELGLELIGTFEFNAIQDTQPSNKRRLMTHEKENIKMTLIDSINKKKPVVVVERLPKSEIEARTLQQQKSNIIIMNPQEEAQHHNASTISAPPTLNSPPPTTKRQDSSTTLSTSTTNSTKTTATVTKNKDSLKSVASKQSTSVEHKENTTITTSRNKSKGTAQDKKKISDEQECQDIIEKDQQTIWDSSKVSFTEKPSKSETMKPITNSTNNNNIVSTPVTAKTSITEQTIPSSASKCFDKTYVTSSNKNNNNNNGNQDGGFIPPLSLNTTHVIKHSTTKTTSITISNNQDKIPVINTPPFSSHQNFGNVGNQTYVVSNLVEAPVSDSNRTYVKPVFDETFDVSIAPKGTMNYIPQNLPSSSSTSSGNVILPNLTTTNCNNNNKITTVTTKTTRSTSNQNIIPVIQEQRTSTNMGDDNNKPVENLNNNMGGLLLDKGSKISSSSTQSTKHKIGKYPSASSLSSNSSSSSYSSASSVQAGKTKDNVRSSPREKLKKTNSETVTSWTVPKPTNNRQDDCAQKKKEIDAQKREAQRKKNEEWKLRIEKKRQADAAEAEEKARREKEKQAAEAKKALMANVGKKDDKIKYPMNPPLCNALKLGGVSKTKFIGGTATGGSCPDIKKLAQSQVKQTKLGIQNASSTGTLPTSGVQNSGMGGVSSSSSSKQVGGGGDMKGSSATKNWKPMSKIANDNVGPSHKHAMESNKPKSPVKIQHIPPQKQLPPPPPPPPHREPEPPLPEDSFYSVADSTFVSQYEITLYQDLDDDLRHRENKPIPNWAKDPEVLHKSLFFQQPDLINCMTRSCFPQKNVGYQIFSNRGINMRK